MHYTRVLIDGIGIFARSMDCRRSGDCNEKQLNIHPIECPCEKGLQIPSTIQLGRVPSDLEVMEIWVPVELHLFPVRISNVL